MYDGDRSQPGDIEKHFEVWKGRFLSTGSVGSAAKFETALGLSQAADGPPTADGGGGTDAAGPPTTDGGGGGGTDAQAMELTRKISSMKAQIEQLEQRKIILKESIQLPTTNVPLS